MNNLYDWSKAPKDAIVACTDQNGESWFSNEEVSMDKFDWIGNGKFITTHLLPFSGITDWKQSKEYRPGYKPEPKTINDDTPENITQLNAQESGALVDELLNESRKLNQCVENVRQIMAELNQAGHYIYIPAVVNESWELVGTKLDTTGIIFTYKTKVAENGI